MLLNLKLEVWWLTQCQVWIQENRNQEICFRVVVSKVGTNSNIWLLFPSKLVKIYVFLFPETIQDDDLVYNTPRINNTDKSMPCTSYSSEVRHDMIPMPTESFRMPGYVLVIINHDFPSSPLPRGKDIEKIHRLFSKQNYKVRCFTNQTKKDILGIINYYSSKSDSKSLICFLSSHGDQTSLACHVDKASDESSVKILDVLESANTYQLMNRPKIFFIDACRTPTGATIRGRDIPEPPGTGYYVGFSSLNLTTSRVLGEESCGIYFETLIEVFTDGFRRPTVEANKIRDLNHLMEKVHHAIAQRKDADGKCFQTSVFKSTLLGKVFLHKQTSSVYKPKNRFVQTGIVL